MWEGCDQSDYTTKNPLEGFGLVVRHIPTGIVLIEHVEAYRGDPGMVYLLRSGSGEDWAVELHLDWDLMDARLRRAGETWKTAQDFTALSQKFGGHYYIRKIGGEDSYGLVPWSGGLVEVLVHMIFIHKDAWGFAKGHVRKKAVIDFRPTQLPNTLHQIFDVFDMECFK